MIFIDQELSRQQRVELLALFKKRGHVGYFVNDKGFARISGGAFVSDEEFLAAIQGKVPPHEIAWIVSA